MVVASHDEQPNGGPANDGQPNGLCQAKWWWPANDGQPNGICQPIMSSQMVVASQYEQPTGGCRPTISSQI
eukprot:11211409-Lingulodinium_polyedra.AAC.1